MRRVPQPGKFLPPKHPDLLDVCLMGSIFRLGILFAISGEVCTDSHPVTIVSGVSRESLDSRAAATRRMLEVPLLVLLPQAPEAGSAKLQQQRPRRLALMATRVMRQLQQRSGTPRSKLLSKTRKMVTVLKLKLDLLTLETLEMKKNDRTPCYSYIRTSEIC